MPTDRGGLGGAALASELDLSGNAAAWNARSGDKRWVDRWFNFSCSLGLDYSGEWAAAEAPLITVLDATIGVDPLVVDMSQVQVTPAATAHIQNKPRNANAAQTAVDGGAADPGLAVGGSFLDAALVALSGDFGQTAAPDLVDVYIGDADLSARTAATPGSHSTCRRTSWRSSSGR